MKEDYILGTNETELDRLKFQHSVWGSVSRDLFSRLKISKGMKCLDVGAGPGFASFDLREIIGEEGELTILEPDENFLNHLKSVSQKNNWTNIKYIKGIVEDGLLNENYYDFIFVRWVIAFVPGPEKFLTILVNSLKENGLISVQDYAGEGPKIYPGGGVFENVYDTVRKYWAYGGGDLYVGKRIPEMYRKSGVELVDFKANCLAGGPDSGVFRWADKFFTAHIPHMIELGIITEEYGKDILEDWYKHKSNLNSVFFSPIVVDVSGRKIKT